MSNRLGSQLSQNSDESGSTMKTLLSVTLLAVAPSLFAETLSQPSFRIEVDDGWVHSIEKGPQSQDGFGDLISIHHPNRAGVLKIQSYPVPNSVDPKRLREMTNVDWSEQLDWESWGDFSGYQHNYSEGGLFYRQWWLTGKKTIVFFVHSASAEPKQAEKNEINKIVRSITAN